MLMNHETLSQHQCIRHIQMSRVAAGAPRLRNQNVSAKRSASSDPEAPIRVPLSQRSTNTDNIPVSSRVKKTVDPPAPTVTTRRSSLRLATTSQSTTIPTRSTSSDKAKATRAKKATKQTPELESSTTVADPETPQTNENEQTDLGLVAAFDAKVNAMADAAHSSNDVLAFHKAVAANNARNEDVNSDDKWEQEAAGQLAKIRYTNLDHSLCEYDIKALTEENTQINTDVASMPLSTEETQRLRRMARASTLKKLKAGRLHIPYSVQIIEDKNEQHEVSFYLNDDLVYREDELDMDDIDDDEEDDYEQEEAVPEEVPELPVPASGKKHISGLRKPQISLQDMLTPVKAPVSQSALARDSQITGTGRGIQRTATPRFAGDVKQQTRVTDAKIVHTPHVSTKADPKAKQCSTPFYPSRADNDVDNMDDDSSLFVDTYRSQLSQLEEREREEEKVFDEQFGGSRQVIMDDECTQDISLVDMSENAENTTGNTSENSELTGIFSSVRQLNYSDDSFDKNVDNSYVNDSNTGLFSSFGVKMHMDHVSTVNNSAHTGSEPKPSPSLLPCLPSPKVPVRSSSITGDSVSGMTAKMDVESGSRASFNEIDQLISEKVISKADTAASVDIDNIVQQFLQKSSVARDRSRIEAALERLETIKHDHDNLPSDSASPSAPNTHNDTPSAAITASTPFKTRTLSSLLLTPSSNAAVFEDLTNPAPVKHYFPTVRGDDASLSADNSDNADHVEVEGAGRDTDVSVGAPSSTEETLKHLQQDMNAAIKKSMHLHKENKGRSFIRNTVAVAGMVSVAAAVGFFGVDMSPLGMTMEHMDVLKRITLPITKLGQVTEMIVDIPAITGLSTVVDDNIVVMSGDAATIEQSNTFIASLTDDMVISAQVTLDTVASTSIKTDAQAPVNVDVSQNVVAESNTEVTDTPRDVAEAHVKEEVKSDSISASVDTLDMSEMTPEAVDDGNIVAEVNLATDAIQAAVTEETNKVVSEGVSHDDVAALSPVAVDDVVPTEDITMSTVVSANNVVDITAEEQLVEVSNSEDEAVIHEVETPVAVEKSTGDEVAEEDLDALDALMAELLG